VQDDPNVLDVASVKKGEVRTLPWQYAPEPGQASKSKTGGQDGGHLNGGGWGKKAEKKLRMAVSNL